MTQDQTVTAPETRRLMGITADGAVKVLLGAVYLIGASRLDDSLGVPTWLMVGSGVALLFGGGIEITYVRSRPLATYRRLMIAYDGGWVLATLAGLLTAWLGGVAGGEVWVGYQTVAPVVLAVLLLSAAPVRPVLDTGVGNSTP